MSSTVCEMAAHTQANETDSFVKFVSHLRHVEMRYLNGQKPSSEEELDRCWLVLPLFQKNQDMPEDLDGTTSLLAAHVDVLRQLIVDYDQKMLAEGRSRCKRLKRTEEEEDSASDSELEEGEVCDE